MSEEMRLPDHLAACEAMLAGQPLAPSGVDRDQLLYRAGWAACEAQRERAATPADLSPPPGMGRTAAWSLASAALAASLAVAATLQWQSPRRGELAEDGGLAAPPSASLVAAPTPPQPAPAADYADSDAYLLAAIDKAGAQRVTAPLLAMYLHPTRLVRPRSAAELTVNDVSAPSSKSARELRQELLPQDPASAGKGASPFVWPWKSRPTGEAI
jgi:hypothetical protein